ncbi:MAG: nuclear transport factor 2 family protein [Gammaproteobacteria bacterium]
MSTEHPALTLVREFLEATMVPDPEKAETYLCREVAITFTGGRAFSHPREIAAFNSQRYRWVKKKLTSFDLCETPQGTVVYSLGTLYGAWPDGTPFEDNRFIDRFLVREGTIVKMDVWNDSAERLLTSRESG